MSTQPEQETKTLNGPFNLSGLEVRKIISQSGIGGLLLLGFAYILNYHIQPIAIEAEKGRMSLTVELKEVNTRLFGIEKRTDVLISLGEERMKNMATDIKEVRDDLREYINNADIASLRSRIMQLESKIKSLEAK